MDFTQYKYMAQDVARILEAASGRGCSTSLLHYFATAGLVVPEGKYKFTTKYYRFHQVVILYICRFLKTYGVPATKIKQVIGPRFYVAIKDAITEEGEWYVIGTETDAFITKMLDDAPTGEFYWCLPLVNFKLDVMKAMDELMKYNELSLVPL